MHPKLDAHKLRISSALQCSKDHNGNTNSENEAVPDEGITSMADVSAIMDDSMDSELEGLPSVPESMLEREEENGSVSALPNAYGTRLCRMSRYSFRNLYTILFFFKKRKRKRERGLL